ncbi:MAG: hypothetical protein L3J67_13535 [Hyphomicrobiaceae bacterium]|nr:hypothetical protein [Hyphomicrobiaceae bacterium]
MTDNNQTRQNEARTSFTGKRLTASQFDESWAVAGIIEREIHNSGSFREKLTDYSHAFSRSEKFDQMNGETIIRDIFKSRTGQTMNQMREGLMEREATLRDTGQDQALHHARSIKGMIKDGETMPFYRAYDHAAVQMAQQHNITETGAKTLMKDAFAHAEDRELYEASKELEQQYHTPKREAERVARQTNRKQTVARTPARRM